MAEPEVPYYVDNYDVFLSFRGPDVRSGFVSHLYQDLKDAGIHVFLDNEELTYGVRLDEELPQAIDNSSIYIPVLSETYASSKWCLRELARIVENKNKDSANKEILPVFYRVTTDDVKLKTDLFESKVNSHRGKKLTDGTIEEWKTALKSMPERRGWTLPSNSLKEFCHEIVKRVLVVLKVKHKQVPNDLVGMDVPVDSLMELLDIGSPDIRVIGIHGMGGIGKTTLATVVYNKLCDSFRRCSFLLRDVRESLHEDKGSRGCLELQKKLLEAVCYRGEVGKIRDVDEAIRTIQRSLKGKRVLMVFDDVSEANQIARLIGNNSALFSSGSRIIITTRDDRTLKIKEFVKFVTKIHNMEEMNKEHALQLFSWHAFGKPNPLEKYFSLSMDVLNLTGGLPLSLEVIGSLLFRENEKRWTSIIEQLKKIPAKKVQERLKIGYEDLSEGAKEIFLDISCFFFNKKKAYEVYMWEACDFFPQLGIDELVSMCFIKIKEERYWMHDNMIKLGRDIVVQEGLKNQEHCSRFWMKEDVINILTRSKKENSNVKAIQLMDLQHTDVDEELWTLKPENFTNLDKLRFFQLNSKSPRSGYTNSKSIKVKVEGTFNHLFPNLRWLSWHYIPLEQFSVTKFNFKKLVILELSYSDITENWGGWKEIEDINSLEVLDLTGCEYLKKTPDLTQYTSLKRLILTGCINLEEIDPSIINLKSLKYLHLINCFSLKGLPEEVFTLIHLVEIIGDIGTIADDDAIITKIPESVGELTSLVTLKLFSLQMIQLPDAIGRLVNLQSLYLSWNTKLQSLPDSVGGLVKLEHLVLHFCSDLVSLPDSLTSLPKLERLDLSFCQKLGSLPDSVGKMVQLKEIDIYATGLKKLPRFITMQKKLEKLTAGGANLEGIPYEIEELPSLRVVRLEGSRISGLPSLIQLSRLEQLILKGSDRLEQLPQLPTSLVQLSALLPSVPDFSCLTNLVKLTLILRAGKCVNELECFSLLSSIVRLVSLKELYLSISGCGDLAGIHGLGELKSLESLEIRGCDSLERLDDISKLTQLTSLVIFDCKKLRVIGIPDLQSLERLEILQCESLECLVVLSVMENEDDDDAKGFVNLSKLKELGVIIKIEDRPKLEEEEEEEEDNYTACEESCTYNSDIVDWVTTNDEDQQLESHHDSHNRCVRISSSDEELEKTTTLPTRSSFNFTAAQMKMRAFSMHDPSPAAEELAIYEQLHSLLVNEDTPLESSPPPIDTKEAKMVLKHFLSGGIKMLEEESFVITAVLDAAKALSLSNPSDSGFWDHFSSKIRIASSSYKLNLERIKASKAVRARYTEIKESAKEITTHYESVKKKTDHIQASKEKMQSEINALRAQLAELEKRVVEADQQLNDGASERRVVVGEMEGRFRDLKATRDEMQSEDSAASEAWLMSLNANWNAWRAYLSFLT